MIFDLQANIVVAIISLTYVRLSVCLQYNYFQKPWCRKIIISLQQLDVFSLSPALRYVTHAFSGILLVRNVFVPRLQTFWKLLLRFLTFFKRFIKFLFERFFLHLWSTEVIDIGLPSACTAVQCFFKPGFQPYARNARSSQWHGWHLPVCIQCRLQTTPLLCQPRSCLAIVSAVTVGELLLWPALRYGTGYHYQTVWETPAISRDSFRHSLKTFLFSAYLCT